MAGVAAETADVLVAGDGPEAGGAGMHGVFGPERRQHVEVVVPEKERSVAGIDPGQVDLVPLVPGHGASVLCSAVRTFPSSTSRSGA